MPPALIPVTGPGAVVAERYRVVEPLVNMTAFVAAETHSSSIWAFRAGRDVRYVRVRLRSSRGVPVLRRSSARACSRVPAIRNTFHHRE
jgi:hypothetical protein